MLLDDLLHALPELLHILSMRTGFADFLLLAIRLLLGAVDGARILLKLLFQNFLALYIALRVLALSFWFLQLSHAVLVRRLIGQSS